MLVSIITTVTSTAQMLELQLEQITLTHANWLVNTILWHETVEQIPYISGYYRDGVPVYGFCKDSSSLMFTSCYKLNSGASTSTVVTVSGTYTVASSNSDYTFSADSNCNLDEANGLLDINKSFFKYKLNFRCYSSNYRRVLLLYDNWISLDPHQICWRSGSCKLQVLTVTVISLVLGHV